jgi:hypothetical protein
MSDIVVYWYNILIYVCRGFSQLLSRGLQILDSSHIPPNYAVI